MKQIEIKNLEFSYVCQSESVLKDVSFDVESGDFIVVSGRSGSGKSTLLKLIKKEMRPKGELSGEINYLCQGHIGYTYSCIPYYIIRT